MRPFDRILAGRSAREVRVVVALTAVVVAVLVYALAWLPLERARTRLAQQLPALRASVEAMQHQADAVKRLRPLPVKANVQAPLATLASAPPAGAQVSVVDAGHVRLSAADAAFASIIEWVVAAQSSHGLHVDSARVDALPAAGRVKADIVMARP